MRRFHFRKWGRGGGGGAGGQPQVAISAYSSSEHDDGGGGWDYDDDMFLPGSEHALSRQRIPVARLLAQAPASPHLLRVHAILDRRQAFPTEAIHGEGRAPVLCIYLRACIPLTALALHDIGRRLLCDAAGGRLIGRLLLRNIGGKLLGMLLLHDILPSLLHILGVPPILAAASEKLKSHGSHTKAMQ